mgnify:CR=1 FL=1
MAINFSELNIIHIICIFFISIIYFLGGVSISKILDLICQKIFREENNYKERKDKYTEKGKILIILETSIQIGFICILIFIFRFFVNNLIKILCPIHTEKYALLIIAPTVFIKQKILKEKIEYIWS